MMKRGEINMGKGIDALVSVADLLDEKNALRRQVEELAAENTTLKKAYEDLKTHFTVSAEFEKEVMAWWRKERPEMFDKLAAREAELAEAKKRLSSQINFNRKLGREIDQAYIKVDAVNQKLAARDARIMVLTEALEFYADEENYEESCTNNENGYECNDEGPIYHDWGERARQALSGKESGAITPVNDVRPKIDECERELIEYLMGTKDMPKVKFNPAVDEEGD